MEKFSARYMSRHILEDNVLIDQKQLLSATDEPQSQQFFSMFFFKGLCAHCNNDVAVYDPE
jgi:hypothetical protein